MRRGVRLPTKPKSLLCKSASLPRTVNVAMEWMTWIKGELGRINANATRSRSCVISCLNCLACAEVVLRIVCCHAKSAARLYVGRVARSCAIFPRLEEAVDVSCSCSGCEGSLLASVLSTSLFCCSLKRR